MIECSKTLLRKNHTNSTSDEENRGLKSKSSKKEDNSTKLVFLKLNEKERRDLPEDFRTIGTVKVRK